MTGTTGGNYLHPTQQWMEPDDDVNDDIVIMHSNIVFILGGCPFNGPLSGTKYPTRAASPIQNASMPKSSLPF